MRTLRVDGDAEGGGGGGRDDALPLDRALACFVGAIPHPDEWKVRHYATITGEVMVLIKPNMIDSHRGTCGFGRTGHWDSMYWQYYGDHS